MTKETFVKSKAFKILLPLLTLCLVLLLFKEGHMLGQWLYRVLH